MSNSVMACLRPVERGLMPGACISSFGTCGRAGGACTATNGATSWTSRSVAFQRHTVAAVGGRGQAADALKLCQGFRLTVRARATRIFTRRLSFLLRARHSHQTRRLNSQFVTHGLQYTERWMLRAKNSSENTLAYPLQTLAKLCRISLSVRENSLKGTEMTSKVILQLVDVEGNEIDRRERVCDTSNSESGRDKFDSCKTQVMSRPDANLSSAGFVSYANYFAVPIGCGHTVIGHFVI